MKRAAVDVQLDLPRRPLLVVTADLNPDGGERPIELTVNWHPDARRMGTAVRLDLLHGVITVCRLTEESTEGGC